MLLPFSRHNFKDISDLYLAADFQLSKLTSTSDFADFHAISPEIRQTLDVCPYAQETGYTYFSRKTLSMPEHLRKIYKRITDKAVFDQLAMLIKQIITIKRETP